MKIIDISQEVLSCAVYPGDPVPQATELLRTREGGLYNLSGFSMCAHNGTHVDAPFHFLPEGKTIDRLPLDAFVGPCYVARHESLVTAQDAEHILQKAAAAAAAERILIGGPVTVTPKAAEVFAAAGIRLIGNEGTSVGPEDAPMEVHRILMEKEIVLLEGIILTDVAEGKYFLSAAPLNISGLEGSPCRAYLISE